MREAIGLSMTKSADYEVLAQAIKDKTGEKLGVNTLKRMFGYFRDRVEPRRSTMDVIAAYLGYYNYDALIVVITEDADISSFMPVETLEVQTLEKDTRVKITYFPNREIVLAYEGDFCFRVMALEGSLQLELGDVLTITQLAVGHRLLAAHVMRNGEDLGGYEAAKSHGLKSVEIIKD